MGYAHQTVRHSAKELGKRTGKHGWRGMCLERGQTWLRGSIPPLERDEHAGALGRIHVLAERRQHGRGHTIPAGYLICQDLGQVRDLRDTSRTNPMNKPLTDEQQRDLDKAARILLLTRRVSGKECPQRPNKAEANLGFKVVESRIEFLVREGKWSRRIDRPTLHPR